MSRVCPRPAYVQVRVLEAERLAALQTAAAARQEVSQLQEARRRLEWQSQLLEKMSKVCCVLAGRAAGWPCTPVMHTLAVLWPC
jgi:hypothetical protein